MGAPSTSRMAMLAKTQFCKSGQILPFEFPGGHMANPHWQEAFTSADHSVPPLPVAPAAALFTCVSTNQKHVETQIKISAEFHAYINGICKAICCAWKDWSQQARLQNVSVNAAIASGGVVTGPPWMPKILMKGPTDTKMKKAYTLAIAKAIGDAWTKYEASLKPVGLAWYPPFAATHPGPATPTNNVPATISQLSQDASGLTRMALAKAMLGNLEASIAFGDVVGVASAAATGGAGAAAGAAAKSIISGSLRPHAMALMDSLAYAFDESFKIWQTTSMVSKVQGSGSNPSNVPGPVVGGIGNMMPGGFEGAVPDSAMIFNAIGPKEGNVSGLYDDKAPGPNASKPAKGLNWGGSHAIGYGTDLGRTFDPNHLTADQIFKRSLFNQLGYSDDDFARFQRQELFLRDGEAERLFALSISDPTGGYIRVARGLFPNLGSYTLEQQIGVIDLCYNYGSGHLAKFGKPVIDAIKSGDWHAAGEAVLNLPSNGTTYGVANAARANAIKGSLQTPPEPDPCG
jgi:hypothetical protein